MDYIVTAVKERAPFVEYLNYHLPNLIIVWDKYKDPMETFMRAWGENPNNASLRFQDDIILTENFLDKAHSVIEKYPNDVIQFFSMRKADTEIGSRWESGGNWIGNLCHYLPAGMSEEIYNFGLTWGGLLANPTADDLLMRDYFKSKKIKYFLHCPSLVEHAQVYSVIDRKRSKFRNSKTFNNPDYKKFPIIEDYVVRMKHLDVDDFTPIK